MLSSIEAVGLLEEIEKRIKDPALVEYFRITDKNFDTDTFRKWADLNFCFNVLINEMEMTE